jgi:hypothetical protein
MNRSILVTAWMAAAAIVHGGDGSGVSINGKALSEHAVMALRAGLKIELPPGDYLLDGKGCWLNLATGVRGCLREGGDCADTGTTAC